MADDKHRSSSYDRIVAIEESGDFRVQEHLATLGISPLSEWDALVFLYRHGATLASASQIARLLGYGEAALGNALDRLESLGLVKCLLGDKGLRLYRYTPPKEPARLSSFVELMGLGERPIGRQQIRSHLRQSGSEPPTGADDSAVPLKRGVIVDSCNGSRSSPASFSRCFPVRSSHSCLTVSAAIARGCVAVGIGYFVV